MSFFKPYLLLLVVPAVLQAQPAAPLSKEDLDFIGKAASLERELSQRQKEGGVALSVASKLSEADRAAVAQVVKEGTQQSRPLSASEQQMIKDLQKAADRPMSAWLDQLDGTGLVSSNMEAMAAQETSQPPTQMPDNVRLLVFISMGMPEGTLKSYFSQSWDDPGIVFVLRGWQPPNLNGILSRIKKLQAGPEMPPNVIVDPNLYQQYEVGQVPMFLAQDKTGAWRRLYGEISLAGAQEQIEKGNYDSKEAARQVGPTYAIEEPDILKEIEKRIAAHDWDAELEGARKRAASYRPGMELPMAEKDEVYFVDPTFTLKEDIVNPDNGQLVAAAGTTINPLDTVSLDKKYMVFDPESRGQVEMAKAFTSAHPLSALIATFLPDYEEGKRGLAEELKTQIFTLNPQLVERFALKATPSVVEQEGRFLKITIKRVPL